MPRSLLRWSLLAIVSVCLNGCSTHHKDGPPSFYVDASKIPDAVPKAEPLSRIGNKPYYTVFGKRYYVMRSSRNYEEQGTASWYGTQFHTHHTSSGERYNMLAMTAAHKTLPLPTYVQVTNLRNNKKVIVKINDRGPFESNRLIDLSYVAAKKLGMLGHGTTLVDVKAIDPRDAEPMPTFQPAPVFTVENTHPRHKLSHQKPDLYLQIGAFHNIHYAENLKKRITTVLHSPVHIHSAKNWYHVQVGPLKDEATASRISKRLHTIGLKTKRINMIVTTQPYA